MTSNTLIDELEQRGLLAQISDKRLLSDHLNSRSRIVYCSFDPTADNSHIGHLVPLLMLRRFKLARHKAIALVSRAGDLSFKATERI